jgi:hypothetical protein
MSRLRCRYCKNLSVARYRREESHGIHLGANDIDPRVAGSAVGQLLQLLRLHVHRVRPGAGAVFSDGEEHDAGPLAEPPQVDSVMRPHLEPQHQDTPTPGHLPHGAYVQVPVDQGYGDQDDATEWQPCFAEAGVGAEPCFDEAQLLLLAVRILCRDAHQTQAPRIVVRPRDAVGRQGDLPGLGVRRAPTAGAASMPRCRGARRPGPARAAGARGSWGRATAPPPAGVQRVGAERREAAAVVHDEHAEEEERRALERVVVVAGEQGARVAPGPVAAGSESGGRRAVSHVIGLSKQSRSSRTTRLLRDATGGSTPAAARSNAARRHACPVSRGRRRPRLRCADFIQESSLWCGHRTRAEAGRRGLGEMLACASRCLLVYVQRRSADYEFRARDSKAQQILQSIVLEVTQS